ncbi:MAG: Wzz/FepE/Etk N-terminal domain-containing protein, partial [Gemmatimonadota bacterium]|nr:Wzz/FepE/Etk N-terminal domain-containing protein [Gemmatimonadota bacterium]
MTRPRTTEPLGVPPPDTREGVIAGVRPASQISVVNLVNVLLRNRVMIIILALAFGFNAGLKSIRSAKTYTSEAQFMPKGARGQTQLTGIAAQLGITVGGGEAAQSAQFYVD